MTAFCHFPDSQMLEWSLNGLLPLAPDATSDSVATSRVPDTALDYVATYLKRRVVLWI